MRNYLSVIWVAKKEYVKKPESQGYSAIQDPTLKCVTQKEVWYFSVNTLIKLSRHIYNENTKIDQI